jgi:hypothetical protein
VEIRVSDSFFLILVSPVLKSSFRMFHSHHHKLVNRYGIYGCLRWPRICSVCRRHTDTITFVFPRSNQRWLITGYFTWITRRVQILEHELLVFAEYLGSSWFIVVFLLLNLYISVICVALTTTTCRFVLVLLTIKLAVLYWYRLLSTLFDSFTQFLSWWFVFTKFVFCSNLSDHVVWRLTFNLSNTIYFLKRTWFFYVLSEKHGMFIIL